MPCIFSTNNNTQHKHDYSAGTVHNVHTVTACICIQSHWHHKGDPYGPCYLPCPLLFQCNLAVPASENNAEVLGSSQLRTQTLVVYGESLLRLGHARKAESVLDKALMLRKFILKPKGGMPPISLGDNEIMSDMGESRCLGG